MLGKNRGRNQNGPNDNQRLRPSYRVGPGRNLYQIKRGNNGVSLDVADRIVAKFPEVSKLWLLTGDGQMINGDAPAGPWSNIGTPNSKAFLGFAAALLLPELINKSECRDPYTLAVDHAEKLVAALAKKGGQQ